MMMDLFRHLRIHTKTKKTKEVKNTGTYIDKLKKEETEKEKMDKHFNGKSYVKDGIESDF
tara:strand:- start:721 stop:900 length:180 start_codon:yes stop_codon:yes gene_type:complete